MADANIGVKFGGCGIILERARMIPKKKEIKKFIIHCLFLKHFRV